MRKPARTFQDLIVWQKVHEFVLTVYRITRDFPKPEMYGLTSQIRRSSVSIAANIAEGFKKKGKLDKARYFNMAQGSLEETRYYLILAQDLSYCDSSSPNRQLEEVGKLLDSYLNSIQQSIK